MIAERLFRQGIPFSGSDVGLKGPIPTGILVFVEHLFDSLHTTYSYLSASMGLIRDAFTAG